MAESDGILKSSFELVALTIDLTGDELVRLPARLASVLQSPQVSNAIRKALDQEARGLLKQYDKSGGVRGADEAKAFAGKLGKTALKVGSKELLRQIKNSSSVRKLKKEAGEVLDKVKASPVGVWVDKNKIYIVCAVVALGVGGGVVMYYTKSGDKAASLVEGLSKSFKIGQITVKGALVRFQPSTRTVGAKVSAAGTWRGVKADLSIAGTLVGRSGQVTADGKIIVPLRRGLVATARGRVRAGDLPPSGAAGATTEARRAATDSITGWRVQEYSAALGLRFSDKGLSFDVLAQVKDGGVGGQALLGYKGRLGSLTYALSGSASIGPARLSGRGALGLPIGPPAKPGPAAAFSVTGSLAIGF